MRILTGAALAAALLLTGCGTQVDPFAASPAEVEAQANADAAQAKADAEADALALALEACLLYVSEVSPRISEKYLQLAENAASAAQVASVAAYLDPRWRTLADAFPLVGELNRLNHYVANVPRDGELRPEARQEIIQTRRYVRVVSAECNAAHALREGSPYFGYTTTD